MVWSSLKFENSPKSHFQDGPRTEPDPETGTVATIFQEPKEEPERRNRFSGTETGTVPSTKILLLQPHPPLTAISWALRARNPERVSLDGGNSAIVVGF